MGIITSMKAGSAKITFPIYDKYAPFYAANELYGNFARQMSVDILAYLRQKEFHPQRALDVACGCGTALAAFAKNGIEAVGVDASAAMLSEAIATTIGHEKPVPLYHQDMRRLDLVDEGPFDLITCMYDSVNYLLTERELGQMFARVDELLQPHGYFIFDIATIYGLAISFNAPLAVINGNRHTEYHEATFHFSNMLWIKTVTCVAPTNADWTTFSEEHVEKAFSLPAVEAQLEKSGLELAAVYGPRFAAPSLTDSRSILVCRPCQ